MDVWLAGSDGTHVFTTSTLYYKEISSTLFADWQKIVQIKSKATFNNMTIHSSGTTGHWTNYRWCNNLQLFPKSSKDGRRECFCLTQRLDVFPKES